LASRLATSARKPTCSHGSGPAKVTRRQPTSTASRRASSYSLSCASLQTIVTSSTSTTSALNPVGTVGGRQSTGHRLTARCVGSSSGRRSAGGCELTVPTLVRVSCRGQGVRTVQTHRPDPDDSTTYLE